MYESPSKIVKSIKFEPREKIMDRSPLCRHIKIQQLCLFTINNKIFQNLTLLNLSVVSPLIWRLIS